MGSVKDYETNLVRLVLAGKLKDAPAVHLVGARVYIKTVFAPGMQSTGNF